MNDKVTTIEEAIAALKAAQVEHALRVKARDDADAAAVAASNACTTSRENVMRAEKDLIAAVMATP